MGIGALQPMHLLLILAIVLVVFGAGKLGQIGGALGKSVREFKTNVVDPEEEARQAAEEARLAAEAESAKPAIKSVAKEPVAVAARATETLKREEI